MPLVVILDSADVDLERDAVAAQLTKAGQDVAGFELRGLNIRTQEEAMAHEAIPEADVVVMWHTLKADAALLARMTAARAIVRVGVGYDNLDLVAAGALGLPVCNIPDYGTEEVADHALTLLLSLYRRVPQITAALAADAAAHGSEGVRDVARGTRRVRGQVLGIVGFGAIGMAVAVRAKAFGFDVRFYDPYLPAGRAKALGVAPACASFEELLAASDALSFHCTLNPSSRRMLNARAIAQLRRGAFVVNTARGGIIDEAALADALRSGHVAGAGIDVHEVEPFSPADRAQPLAGAPNCLCTPHTAFYSDASFVEIRTKAAAEAARAVLGEPLTNVVNAHCLAAPARAPVALTAPPR